MGLGGALLARMITALSALRIATIYEEFFAQGKAFSFEDYFSFAAEEAKTFVFDGTGFTGEQIVFSPLVFSGTSGPLLVDFHAGITSNADGTLLQPSNRQQAGDSPVSTLRLNPTGTNLGAGNRFAGDLVPATGLNPATSTGCGNMPSLPFEIDKILKQALKITNTDGEDVYALIKMTWFEI